MSYQIIIIVVIIIITRYCKRTKKQNKKLSHTKVTVIPVVIDALGTISKGFVKEL